LILFFEVNTTTTSSTLLFFARRSTVDADFATGGPIADVGPDCNSRQPYMLVAERPPP
jgi:hypothetical protein